MLPGSTRLSFLTSAFAATLLLSACSGIKSTPIDDSTLKEVKNQPRIPGNIWGGDGILFGGNKSSQDNAGTGIGVNAFLWRGSLDTLSFMPLASADPFGGVIITDWYQPAGSTGERFKATAYILTRQLRADGLKVSIYRQVLQGGQWVDALVSAATTTEIENKILARARELRAEVSGN